MKHPLLHLIATQPQLLAEHADAYGDLLAAEFGKTATAWARRALFIAAALCGLAVAAVLAGVALMLWTTVPAAHLQAPWLLLAVPLLPLAVAIACLLAAQTRNDEPAFAQVRQQVKADLSMLSQASAS